MSPMWRMMPRAWALVLVMPVTARLATTLTLSMRPDGATVDEEMTDDRNKVTMQQSCRDHDTDYEDDCS